MTTGTSASIDTIASLRAFSTAISAPYTFDVQGYYSIGDGGGDIFVYASTDTTSGAYFTGSISGTTLSVASVTNGTLSVGLALGGPGIPAGVWIVAGSGLSWTISKSLAITSTTLTGDNGGTIILDQAGRRWHSMLSGLHVDVRRFGAVGDAVNLSSITTTAGAPFSGVVGRPLTAADIGKAICLPGVGSSGADLITTIATVTGASAGTFAAPASVATTLPGSAWLGTDNAQSLQACLNFCRSNKYAVGIPTGAFATTKSLDYTSTSYPSGLMIIGEDKRYSIIVGMLDESGGSSGGYPVLDCTGASYSQFSNFCINGVGGLAAAGLLNTYSTLSGAGVPARWTSCKGMIVTGYFSAAGIACSSSDFFTLDNTDITVNGCPAWLCGGGALPPGSNGITSKFQTIYSVFDCTQQIATNTSKFVVYPDRSGAASVPFAINYTQADKLIFGDVYIGMTGVETGGSAIYVSGSNSGVQSAIMSTGLRVEQNGAGVVNVATVDTTGLTGGAYCSRSRLVGDFNTNYIIRAGSTTSGQFTNAFINSLTPTGTSVFTPNSLAIQCAVESGIPFVSGSMASGSIGNQYKSLRTAVQSFPTLATFPLQGAEIRNGADLGQSWWSYLIHPSAPNAPVKPVGCPLDVALATGCYTGGHGLIQVCTFNLPSSTFQLIGQPAFYQSADLKIVGRIETTAAAAGQIQMSLVQGANTVVLATLTGINAYTSTATNGIVIRVTFYLAGSQSSHTRCLVEMNVGGQVIAPALLNLQTSTIDFNADATINLSVSNTANDPYSFFYVKAQG